MLFISQVARAVPTYFQRSTRVIMFRMITKIFTFFIQCFGEKIASNLLSKLVRDNDAPIDVNSRCLSKHATDQIEHAFNFIQEA